jgi:DNA-binding transcriptional LysR family regulator
VSGQLKALEEELSLPLLSRTTNSVALTQAGLELLGKAEKAIESFVEFRNRAEALSGNVSGKLRVGVAMIDPELMRVGHFMREVITNYPALQIDLEVGRISWFLEALQLGEIDAAIFVGNSAPEHTQALVLTKVWFRLVAPAAWKTRLQNASWSDAALMPWIRTTRPSANHEMITMILREAAINPVEVVEADHELVIRSLVAAGIGIGLMREELAVEAQKAGEVILFGDCRVSSQLMFIYPTERRGDQRICAALAALRKVWGFVESGPSEVDSDR